MPQLKRPSRQRQSYTSPRVTGLVFTPDEFGRFPAPHQKRILKLLWALGKTVAAGRMSAKYQENGHAQ
jgi:hypothetical protein